MEGIGKEIQSMGTYLNKSNSFSTDLVHKIIIKNFMDFWILVMTFQRVYIILY